jgi:hypothetical protein
MKGKFCLYNNRNKTKAKSMNSQAKSLMQTFPQEEVGGSTDRKGGQSVPPFSPSPSEEGRALLLGCWAG